MNQIKRDRTRHKVKRQNSKRKRIGKLLAEIEALKPPLPEFVSVEEVEKRAMEVLSDRGVITLFNNLLNGKKVNWEKVFRKRIEELRQKRKVKE